VDQPLRRPTTAAAESAGEARHHPLQGLRFQLHG
jgi:hypothetical protein